MSAFLGGIQPIQTAHPSAPSAVQYVSRVLDYVTEIVPLGLNGQLQMVPAQTGKLIIPIFALGRMVRTNATAGTTTNWQLRYPTAFSALPTTLLLNNVTSAFANGPGAPLSQFSASEMGTNLQAVWQGNLDYIGQPLMLNCGTAGVATGCQGTFTITVGWIAVTP